MPHPKFTALADRMMQRRLGHLKKIEDAPDLEWNLPPDLIEEKNQLQLDFAFPQSMASLDIFQNFDEKLREVEWSFYNPEGEFLLHFAFSLQDLSYKVFAIHPCLLEGKGKMPNYLEAINYRLKRNYPALELRKFSGEGPKIQKVLA